MLTKRLIGFQLIKKFLTFHVTRKFITAFNTVRHLIVFWARSMQSIHSHSTSWKSNSLLSFNLFLIFQVISFPHVSSPNSYMPHHPTENVSCLGNPVLLDLITRKILDVENKLLSSSLCSFLHFPVTSSLLSTNILLSTLLSNTLNLWSSLNMRDKVSKKAKLEFSIF